MQRRQPRSDLSCGLALLGALLLASPGVQVARADAAPEAGPACSSAKLKQHQDPSLESFLTQIRQRADTRRRREERDRDGWIVLNNRGYNYAPANQPNPYHYAPPAPPAAANRQESAR